MTVYNKQSNCNETQKDLLENIPQIKENELTNTINKQELKQAIHEMENDQPPGIDGIPMESYKESYVILEQNLLQLYNNIFFMEQKSAKTKNQAMITLIPPKKQPKYPQILETKISFKCKLQKLHKNFTK